MDGYGWWVISALTKTLGFRCASAIFCTCPWRTHEVRDFYEIKWHLSYVVKIFSHQQFPERSYLVSSIHLLSLHYMLRTQSLLVPWRRHCIRSFWKVRQLWGGGNPHEGPLMLKAFSQEDLQFQQQLNIRCHEHPPSNQPSIQIRAGLKAERNKEKNVKSSR